MKTPIEELVERLIQYRDSETEPLVISKINSILVDAILLIEREKKIIEDSFDEGYKKAHYEYDV